jgi:hypothetical protein
VPAATLDHIFPGSWINANFDVWIGAEEDNKSWDYLLRARQAYDRAADTPVPEDRRRLAFEELLIAEGSDWNWWYGPEHDSANRPEFDQLYRDHLANVYRCLGQNPPEELSRPILHGALSELHEKPTSPLKPVVDGEVTSYFEWMGAGSYRVDGRTGAMHGQRFLVRELLYGSDGTSLYLRLDFEPGSVGSHAGMEARIRVFNTSQPPSEKHISVRFEAGGVVSDDPDYSLFAFRQVLEGKIQLRPLGITPGQPVRFQLSMWQSGLPLNALPPQGYIEVPTAEPADWSL